MKRLIIFAAVAVIVMISFSGCGNNRKNAEHQDELNSITDTIDNSRSSLDYFGTYVGKFPCADCSGIKVELTITRDGEYTMKSVYEGKGLEKDNTFTDRGIYTWDDSGSVITLDGADTEQYQVGENVLYALDDMGNRINGELADMYILKKK